MVRSRVRDRTSFPCGPGRPGHGPVASGWGCCGHAHSGPCRPVAACPRPRREPRRGRHSGSGTRSPAGRGRRRSRGRKCAAARSGRPRHHERATCRPPSHRRTHDARAGTVRPRRLGVPRDPGRSRPEAEVDLQGRARRGRLRQLESFELQGPQPRLDPGARDQSVGVVLLVLVDRPIRPTASIDGAAPAGTMSTCSAMPTACSSRSTTRTFADGCRRA